MRALGTGRWRRGLAGLAAGAAVLVAAMVPVGERAPGVVTAGMSAQADADDVAAGPPDVLPAGGSWTVTLVTGDVLDVRSDGDGRVAAFPRDASARVRTVQEPDGDLYAIPLSVTPLVERTLDLELFNLTGLIRQGYDDASTDVVPVIVQSEPGIDARATMAMSGNERPLPSIGAVAVELPKATAQATGDQLAAMSAADNIAASPGVAKVWLDRQVQSLSASAAAQTPAEPDDNVTQVGADRAWAAGYQGEGTTVAVLDTGIDAQHPDLVGKVAAEANFSDSPDAVDRLGHGTHVASIVAGTGAAADGAHRGVAPESELINGKVLNDRGFGAESDVIAGMEWAAARADVVNMSLGVSIPSDGSDPMSLALDALTEQNDTLFVVAAGNEGPPSRTVGVPGAADHALTVGAVDSADALARFSSRGPLPGSFEMKPEVVAPGVDIVAARASGSVIGEPVGEQYTRLSGTSMATPHVAGAAALLAQRHPDWSVEQLKNGLVAASDPVDGDGYDVGSGRIDIGDAVDAAMRANHDVVDTKLAHPRTQPEQTELTWTNDGDAPRTVRLDAQLRDRRGDPVDAATIAPAELTVAPGATGMAILAVDGATLDDGLYTGTVTVDPADGPDQDDLRTPIGVYAAPEMVGLTIQSTTPGGVNAQPSSFAAVVNLDDFGQFGDFLFFEDTVTVEVPAGRYAVIGDVSPQDPDAGVTAQVGDPDVSITGDTTVSFDGAAAQPLRPAVVGVETAPPVTSRSVLVTIPRHGAGGFGIGVATGAWYPMPPVYMTPMEADSEIFQTSQSFRLQAPHLTMTIDGAAIDVLGVSGQDLEPGERDLVAVDGGDGSDLSGARGAMAVVQAPAGEDERNAITRRAVDAGVAALAFVDEQRPRLTYFGDLTYPWEDLLVLAAGGPAAATLRSAAGRGDQATVTLAASPYVYDIVRPTTAAVDPAPVIDRAAQRRLARLDERFPRDVGGTGALRDGRLVFSALGGNVASEGPLPEHRIARVTPGITWLSYVSGYGILSSGGLLLPTELVLSVDDGASYEPRSRTAVTWLRRPMAPGPVADLQLVFFCDPSPVVRTSTSLHVWLAPFQGGPNLFGCADPHQAKLTLARDGTVIGSTDDHMADFAIPAEPGRYTLSYEQSGDGLYAGPYPHRSSTTWTFDSAAPAAPADPAAEAPIPLLTVDYELPLDTLNRPTGRTATFTVDQVAGSEQQSIRSLRVWTSTDDGATWQTARARRTADGAYRVTLPRVPSGTGVSLRAQARDAAGSSIDQTLYDAYTG
jgi:subtilisin family serine protease